MNDSTDKTIVITGASSGFGRGAAVELAARGARVVVAARRADLLDELVAEITAAGGAALAVPTDVSDPVAVQRLAEAAEERFGAVDVAVLSLGRSVNEELRLSGDHERISVATILPWAVDTPWWTHAANYSGRTPRMAAMDDPQLVVDAIVEACSDPRPERPVGGKARAADVSHHLFPGLTERLSGRVADAESKKGDPEPPTDGAIHQPMTEGRGVDGGIRERMRREDAEQ